MRLYVHKSNKYLYAQIIDDEKGVTVVGASEKELEAKDKKIDTAKELGKLVAKKAQGKKIKTVVFDRGNRRYHGKIKAVADGAREGGLNF